MRKAKTVKEVLIAAKWMLENVGWHKGSYSKVNSKGAIESFCLVGALWRVETEDEKAYHQGGLIKEATDLVANKANTGSIPSWNDNYLRTKEEVIKLLNDCIEEAQ